MDPIQSFEENTEKISSEKKEMQLYFFQND